MRFLSAGLTDVIIVAFIAILCASHATAQSGRMIDDCNSTKMRVLTRSRFMGGSTYKSRRLAAGAGTLDCANICKGDEDCWSFNYEKNRKVCFLMSSTENELERQRRGAGAWSSGYRECSANSTAWDNAVIEFGKTPLSPPPPAQALFKTFVFSGDYNSGMLACTVSSSAMTCDTDTPSTGVFKGTTASKFGSTYVSFGVDYADNRVYACPLTVSATPSIDFSSSCSVIYSDADDASFVNPRSIAVDGSNAYITLENGKVFTCTVGGDGLSVNSCTSAQSDATYVYRALISDIGPYLYILGGTQHVYQCDLSDLTNCVADPTFQTVSVSNDRMDMAIYGTSYAIFTSDDDNEIWACYVDRSSGFELTGCANIYTVSIADGFAGSGLTSVAIYGTSLYMNVSNGQGMVVCTINGNTISACSFATGSAGNYLGLSAVQLQLS